MFVLAVHGRLGWLAVLVMKLAGIFKFLIADEGLKAPELVLPVRVIRLELGIRESLVSRGVGKD